jgi:hypothetical protein
MKLQALIARDVGCSDFLNKVVIDGNIVFTGFIIPTSHLKRNYLDYDNVEKPLN